MDDNKYKNYTTDKIMNNLSTYIIEKLHINKDINIDNNPFDDYKGKDIPDLLEFIIEKVNINPDIWNDTQTDTLHEEGFSSFDTTDGTSIDWLDAAEREVDATALAIWVNEDILPKEIIKFLIEHSNHEVIYKKAGYVYDLYTFEFKSKIIKILCGRSNEVDKFICLSISD